MDVTAAKRTAEELLNAQTEIAHTTRVTTLGELTASIAHEVNQPLAAVVTSASACLRWLNRENPDLVEARRAVGGNHQRGQSGEWVLGRVRALANKTEIKKVPLDINDVIEEVMLLFRHEAPPMVFRCG